MHQKFQTGEQKGTVKTVLLYLLHLVKEVFAIRYINGFTIRFKRKSTGDISIGEYSYGNIDLYAYSEYFKVDIGRYVSISDIVIIIGGNHHVDVTTYIFRVAFKKSRTDEDNFPPRGIKIGNDVWIGYGAIILDGANIGTGAIIGAGAVVRGNIPPYAIVIGNPGVVIKYRFSEREIDMLLKSEWWDLPAVQLLKLESYLYSKDVESFVENVNKLKHAI